jgi:hypothetical protein
MLKRRAINKCNIIYCNCKLRSSESISYGSFKMKAYVVYDESTVLFSEISGGGKWLKIGCFTKEKSGCRLAERRNDDTPTAVVTAKIGNRFKSFICQDRII